MSIRPIIIILITLLFVRCDNTEEDKYTILFENKTDVTINVSKPNVFEDFKIEPNESIRIEKDFLPINWVYMSHPETDKTIDFRFSDGDYIKFVQFDYTIEYRVYGTASSVDITLSTPNGGTAQYSNVHLPATYRYKYFADSFAYISAQNQGETGDVNVEIWNFEKQAVGIKTDRISGEYGITTSYGTIVPNYRRFDY